MVSLLIAWQRQAICHVVRFASGWEPSGLFQMVQQPDKLADGEDAWLTLELDNKWCLVLGDEGTLGAVAGNGDAACSNLELGGQFVEFDGCFWWAGNGSLPRCSRNAATQLLSILEQRVAHRAVAGMQ